MTEVFIHSLVLGHANVAESATPRLSHFCSLVPRVLQWPLASLRPALARLSRCGSSLIAYPSASVLLMGRAGPLGSADGRAGRYLEPTLAGRRALLI